MTKQGRQL